MVRIKKQSKQSKHPWFDLELGKLIHHPLYYYFDKWTDKLQDRAIFSFVLAFVLALFSRMQPICTQTRCYTYYFQLILNPGFLVKPFSTYIIIMPFVTTLAFFFIAWLFLLSISHLVQKQKLVNRLVIPALVFCIFIYLIFATSGMIRPFMLETGTVECTTSDDCIRAGYCGEICASIYRPIYTSYSENCTPLQTCGCVNFRCVGSN